MIKYKIATDVSTEPVTTAEAKEQIQVIDPSDTSEDNFIDLCISAARRSCENYINRRLAPVTIEVYLNDFEDIDSFYPLFPVTAISSITYKDEAGDNQVLATSKYKLDMYATPQSLVFIDPPDTYRKTDGDSLDNVTISILVGHTAAGEFKQETDIKKAILFLVRSMYDHREDVTERSVHELPFASKALLDPYRMKEFV